MSQTVILEPVAVQQSTQPPNLSSSPDAVNETNVRRRKSRHFKLALLAISLCAFMIALESTILSVALPTIAAELEASSLQSFWVGTSYLLACAVCQPLITSLSETFGRLQLLFSSLAFFAIGSVVFACSKDVAMLLAGRVLQGVGGAGIDVLQEIIITDLTTLKERPLYIGLLNVPIAIGSMAGPILGGLLAEHGAWRWIGWLNLPLAGLAVVLSRLFLRLRPIRGSIRTKLNSLDWIGMLLFALGFTAITLSISWGGTYFSWDSAETLVPLIFGAVAVTAFCFHERRTRQPMLPWRIFSSRTSTGSLVGAYLHGAVTFCVLFYLPLYFQAAKAQTAWESAISGLPSSLTVIPFAVLSAIAVEISRRYSWIVYVGWISLSIGMGLLSLLNADSTESSMVCFQILASVGFGILFSVLAIPLQAAAPPDDAGVAVGTLVCVRLAGEVTGLAISAAIFQNIFSRKIKLLTLSASTMQAFSDTSDAVRLIPVLNKLNLESAIKKEIRNVYAEALGTIWIALAAIGGLGFFSSLLMKDISLETTELGRQALELPPQSQTTSRAYGNATELRQRTTLS